MTLKSLKLSILYTISVIISFYITHNIINITYIPSDSMRNTLKVGDILIGTRNIKNINRGDIVVFNAPDSDKMYIKRIIGLPNEKIRIEDDEVYINDIKLDENYVFTYSDNDIEEYYIPNDMYFVLGDNRVNSDDSRYYGAINKKEIVSIQKYIIFPLNRINKI